MGRHGCPAQSWLAAFAAGFVACAAPQVFAGDASYCVTCKNPDQTYVCRVTGEDATPSDALKLYCVIRTAKEGNHASCSAQRSDAGCHGIEKVYAYDGPAIPGTSCPTRASSNSRIECSKSSASPKSRRVKRRRRWWSSPAVR